MIVEHKKLYVHTNDWSWRDGFEYSKQCEQALANLLGMQCELAMGNHSQFDFTDPVTGLTYEVKYTMTAVLKIEFRQEKSNAPSGISTSTADFWLYVSKGMTREGELVGKVRKYKLADLEYAVETAIAAGNHDGKRATVDPSKIPHEWMGDVVIDETAGTFNMSRWKRPGFATTGAQSFKRKSSRPPFGKAVPSIGEQFGDVPF